MSCRRHFFRSFSLHIGLTRWKKRISSFTDKDGEKIFSYGERFKDVISICPYHGFGTWMMVPYFYEGMLPQMKKIVETMCGGDIMSKILDEEIQFLEYVANVSIKYGKILYLIENWLELKILHNHLVEEEFII